MSTGYKSIFQDDAGFQKIVREGGGLSELLPYCRTYCYRRGLTAPSRTTIKDTAKLVREANGIPPAPASSLYRKNKTEWLKSSAPAAPKAAPQLDLNDRIREAITKSRKPMPLEELADMFDCAPKAVRSAIDSLREDNYMAGVQDGHVSLRGAPETKTRSTIPDELYSGGQVIKFGAVSDTHLCSRYERLDCLEKMYDIFAEQGVSTVFHSGNHIDGESRFNRQDIHTHGMDNQVRYFVEKYPQRSGIETLFITGDDHEGWYVQQTGIDIGERTEDLARKAGRTDLHHLGYMEHDVVIPAPQGETTIRLIHPGGGTAYALSYQPQKIIESLTGGEKPQIMLIGHYHKADYIYYRNIHCIQSGCFMDQTPFMRKKRLSAHIGGWICEAHQAPDGSITRFKSEWVPFFDREYYRKWEYQK